MGDVEQPHSLNVLHSDNRILVAVVAAIVLTTSSALIYRTKHFTIPAVPMSEHSILNATLSTLHLVEPSPGEKHDADAQPSEKDANGQAKVGESNNEEPVRDSKSSRSKERRRRGKDPLKEMMKGGKKLKGLSKSSRPNTGDADGSSGITSSSGSAVSPPAELDTPQGSNSSSTRSSSPSTKPVPSDHTDTPERPVHVDVAERESEGGTHHNSPLPPLTSIAPEFTLNDFQVDMTDTPDILSNAGSTASTLTPNTSLSVASDNPRDVPHIQSSQSLPYISTPPSFGSDNRRTNKPQNQTSQTYNGPWDWDGQLSPNPPSSNDTNYRKPPRFRSKSRVPSSSSVSPLPASKSYSIPFSGASYSPASPVSNASTSSSSSISLSPIPNAEGSLPSFTFPTLNSASPSSPGPSSISNSNQRPYMNTIGSANSSTGHTPRRVPTPLRTPAGSRGGSPPPSLSTQVASLKSALEVARMREEKSRLDAERYSKECEVLKWKWGEETVAWRHREAELQSQVLHLMHQLQQGYISAFTPSPASPAHLQANQPFSSHHLHPPSPQQPSHLPPHVQMHPANSQTQPRSHSPFFAYQQSPPQPSSSSQPNLRSLLFPAAASGAGVSSSTSGSSSAESTSPQLDSSPFWDRGRARTRTIRNGDKDGSEDWLVLEEHGDPDRQASTAEEDDFSDVLADAILKRPESIRVRARPGRHEAEFSFPSISNLGNVERNKDGGGVGETGQVESIIPKATISNRNVTSSAEGPR